MRTGRYIRTIITMLMLLLYGASEVWADDISVTNDGITVIIDGDISNGTVGLTPENIETISGGHRVTLTVTPNVNFKIKKDLIVVEKMVKPSSRRRTPGVGTFDVTGPDPDPNGWKEGPSAYTYSFNIDEDYHGAYVTATFVSTDGKQITSLAEITDMDGDYELMRDIDASGWSGFDFKDGENNPLPFSGTLDGGLHKIYNLSVPLFNSINGGTVKNVILEDVNISESGNVGAFAAQMTGTSDHIACIYNCGILSGSVSGSGYVGGLVGLLGSTSNNDNCYARVINCYSYANITGGSVRAGIVGYNSYASKSGDIRTMVMNCMFYGHIEAGGTISPIYGGKKINNSNSGRLNNYNYFCYENLPSSLITEYNCALAAEERYLVRFEFYRHLLNSTREVASWYATGSTADAHSKMAKWVLDKDIAPYPILKEQGTYPSVVNYEDAPTLGTLSVSINLGSDAPSGATVSNTSLSIYDKDPDNYHFNYRTVRLPYFHEVGTGNYAPVSGKNYYKAVTGWRITGMTGATTTQATSGTDVTFTDGVVTTTPYNFADRTCTKFENGNYRVFSQGAYFDVPDDVTGITIEPYWGNAVFLSDPYYDKYGYAAGDVTDFGLRYEDGETYSFGDLNLKVYTTIDNALKALPDATSVYDNAVVLVGNYHKGGDKELSEGSKAFTMMSIDLNEDNEPDYSLIFRSGKQQKLAPIRYDFINIPGMAMAHKTESDKNMGIPGNAKPTGWFEITNTALIHYSQFEYDSEFKSGSHPLILLGGVFEQIVSTNGKEDCVKNTKYIHLGSNVWFKLFHNGCHLDKTNTPTPHIPISVTGGDYDKFYLSGYFQPAAKEKTDNAECYISGGRFGEVAGAGQEPIKGDVTWLIDHADIKDFYGGGINNQKPVEGNITVTIKNSKVGTYCGGPKFGNMFDGKKVKTTAMDCEFGTFYGAGFGGTSYYRYLWNGKTNHNQYESVNYDWNGTTWVGHNTYGFTSDTRGKYVNGRGILVNYDYEHFEGSSTNTVARLYMLYASLSLAETKDVTSILTGCTINNNFYGGGKLGSVDGDITSTLSNCTIKGNAYGAGYSGTPPTVDVFSTDGTNGGGFKTIPNYNTNTGVFEKGEYPDTVEYTWSSKGSVTNNSNAGSLTEDSDGNWIHTNTDLNDLGKVTGQVTLDIKEGTTIAGNVYGGGESSDVSVKKSEDPITSHVTVNVKNGTISGSVYGGGEGENTVVAGDVKVNIGTKEDGTPPSYTGDGIITISGNVYGGSGFGAVNASSTKDSDGNVSTYTPSTGKTTEINIYGGTVNGSVFGGGLGQLASGTPGENGYKPAFDAKNFGNTTIAVEHGTVKTAVYGGANLNGVMKEDATVTITGGTVGTYPTGEVGVNSITNVVFGGGFGQPTLVNGNVTVNIGRKKTGEEADHFGNATINGHVYGGSALGCVNASKSGSDPMVFYNVDDNWETKVNLYKGTIKGNVYGGGLGKKEVVAKDAEGVPGDPGYIPAVAHEDGIEAFVGGDVQVLLDGAKLECAFTGSGVDLKPVKGQIFGCNNLNGTPKGHVKVHVKRTVDSSKPTVDGESNPITRDNRPVVTPPATYGYDVAAVYGGGNQADYIPTKATGTAEEKEEAFAEVLIEGCDETSIEYVYGGGNAAAVPATDVTILGTYIIDYVFGGGNGKGTGNPGANIGSYNNGASEYGTGKAVTKLVGGHIMYVFGGSNTKGNVRGGTSISMPEINPDYTAYDCCDVRDIKEIYGAGNEAEQDGAVTMIVGCVDNMDYVYGGARNAHVKGGVDLVITSGHFKGVFGGNDLSGTIQGPITLTIEETGCKPLEIDNLYLGGNQAAYSVYGYKDVSGTLTARSSMSDGEAVNLPTDDPEDPDIIEHQLYRNPVLNVVSCTNIGNVFGGGYGSGATMYGSPTVNINMIPGDYAALIDRDGTPGADDPSGKLLGTIGNVYGGGEEANVDGNTAVNICTAETVTVRSHKGAPVTNEPTAVQGALITENVFGAGKGETANVNSAIVTGNTTITMAGGSVTKSVYGGGQLSQVGGNTNITISGGTIGKDREATATPGEYTYWGGAEYGNVYGAGLGSESGVGFGQVKGNTNITIQKILVDAAWVEAHPDAGKSAGDVLSSPTIYHNIYGGGALASVGDFTYDGTSGLPNGLNTANTGKATITITGGTIGTDGHNNGMVFGSSRGEIDAPNAIHDKLAWVYDTEVVIGTDGSATGPTIHGSLYGGGENGHVYNDASVMMYSGTVGNMTTFYAYRGNVYGAGCGTDMYYSSAIPTGHTAHDGEGDKYNPIAGIVRGNTTVTINGGNVANNVYGAGSMGKVLGNTSVTINTSGYIGAEGEHDGGNVYGAARGELNLTGKIPSEDNVHNYSTVNNSTVIITKGTVRGSVYGGGKAGEVTGAISVTLNGGTVQHDVYGGGALAQTNTSYTSGDTPATAVTLNGATINGDLYGGGLGQLAVAGSDAVLYADEEEYNTAKGTSLDAAAFAALSDAEKTKTPAVAAVAAVAADVNGPVTVTVSSGTAANVFGCNNVNGMPKSTVAVVIGAKSDGGVLSGTGTVSGSVYGGGNQAACTGSPTVTLYGGTVSTNVYGGGLGSTAKTGSATVVMEGGTVGNDVFGGGSQADVTGNVSVSVSGGTITNDVYGGGALANTNTGNWDATTNTWKINSDATETYYIPVKHLTVGTSVVTGYFTGSDGSGEITAADTKAEANTTYYKRIVYVEDIHDIAENGTTYKTTVNLTGGVIGNAYGGGLGKLGTDGTPEGTGYVKAMVYGDVAVNVNGAAFTELVEASAKNAPVTGRVFGCNNINGTPKGNVTVTIYETRRIDGGEHTLGEFEIQGVYGGGNLADYVPETYDGVTEFGQNTRVIINDCAASISKVYGGGNAARVPFTDVTINGAFEIGYVFGGGNGGDMIYKNGSWIDNPGAYVTRYTNVLLKGGTIGQAFGGSDSRGSVGGSDIRQESGGLCPLHLVNLYGAGNGELASSTGDINVDVSGCGEHSEIQNVYGGSYKANITGNVTLNIKSGIFTSVFGGNDRRGSIGGNIYVNIEETDDCDKPIIIQNLYGGCYQTAYPGESDPDNHTPAKDKEGNDFTTGKITVNVKSATRIDRIFGGSDRGEVTGDTEVNINMIRGSMSGHTDVPLPSHYTTTSKPSNIVVTNTEGYVMVYGLIAGESSVEGYYYTDVYTQASGTAVADTKYYRLVPVTFTEIPSAEITVGTTDVSSYYTREVDIYTQASGAAAAATIYYKAITYSYTQVPDAEITVGTTDVSSFYTHSEVSHTLATGQAQPGITYYKPSVKGNILVGIGTIGNVYGGGNIGKVTGNTVVNIGTLQTVTMETVDDDVSTEDVDEKHPKVLGAHIYGDVFGGCNAAPVTGDTEVNIGTADYSGTANFEGIFIDKDTNGNGGSVYGGGSQGDVLGNTNVTMSGGYVYDGVYGGGLMGSVGDFNTSTDVTVFGHTANHDGCVGKPISLKTANTGKCTVVISGGQVGPNAAADKDAMNDGVDVGFVFGAGRGDVEDPNVVPDTHFKTYVNNTDVTISGGLIMASVYGGGENGRVLHDTHVTIKGGQIGCGKGIVDESGNARAYNSTEWAYDVTTNATHYLPECSHWDFGKDTNDDGKPDEFLTFDPFADKEYYETDYGEASTTPTDGKTYYGCVFGGGSGYYPYEIMSGDTPAGHEWLWSAGWVEGNTVVDITGGHILTNIYGGNEYTDVGTAGVANTGKCTVNFGGTATLGVPRTLAQIAAHPVTCYLFGAGKGDPRVHFNTRTNVNDVEVNVDGGIIYGSVFGGGEEGHVLNNVTVNIKPGAKIGTWGTSYVDGNIFGGGRGFNGEALTAGSVGGNIDVNITGGTMLGSVYGGGRLASVGIPFTAPTDPAYGQLKEDEGNNKYGYITVNISGGTIGNDLEFVPVPYEIDTEEELNTWKTSNHIPNTEFYLGKDDKDNDLYLLRHTKGGNVFGGSMGRLTLLNGEANPLWPKLGTVKSTKVNIYGNAEIKGNVYGGGEFSMTRGDTYVTVGGVLGNDNTTVTSNSSDKPTIKRNIYGGGYGSVDRTPTTITAEGFEHEQYTFIPMQMAGIVCGDSHINIAGGNVEKNVYGGGELATVGLPDFAKAKNEKHEGNGTFELSWPYNLEFIRYYNINDPNSPIGGTTHINITGGRIGLTGKDYMGSTTIAETEKNNRREDNGDIYGGGKGVAGDRYDYAFCANVKATEVTIEYPASNGATPENYTAKSGDTYTNDCITGSVYGGGENGHVIEDTHVHLNNGLIGHAIYGGGKGKGKYKKKLDLVGGGTTPDPVDVYSITAGKVYGNTSVTMSGGYVVRNIYGGGNLASVGKGNYAGGSDDYKTGYGEAIETDLWSNAEFTGSGRTIVSVTGGQVGYIDSTTPQNTMKDDLPYGNIFGGCRGRGAAEVQGINVNPDFYLGFVNETDVTIGDASDGPTIYGSVYGGGQDGHVRRDTKVTVNNGKIGAAFVSTSAAETLVGTSDINNNQWLHRGNVYGGGSGIGKYEFDYDGDGTTYTDADSNGKYDEGETVDTHTYTYGGQSVTVKDISYSNSAGSVSRNTTVDIKGGTIHRNVYGGGSLASVFPPGWTLGTEPYEDGKDGKASVNTLNISGGTIGSSDDSGLGYGGNVFGASRGMNDADVNLNYYALSIGTKVNILPHKTGESTYDYTKNPVIWNNVYGGGEMGLVRKNTNVQLTGGEIKHDAYGGGKGVWPHLDGTGGVKADIGGNTIVELNKDVESNAKGCIVRRIFGCNDLNGTPKGHVKVHVFATQNSGTDDISTKVGPGTLASLQQGNSEGYIDYLNRLIALSKDGVVVKPGITASVIEAAETAIDGKVEGTLSDEDKTAITNAAESVIAELEKTHDYDVQAVYGGGDLAMYEPENPDESTEVIIEGCNVTSIKQVYGGGNAAPVSGSNVTVKSCYIIDEVFGGGNGKDNYSLEEGSPAVDVWYENPGANVGYKQLSHYVKSEDTGYDATIHGSGTYADPYKAITNTSSSPEPYNKDATTPEGRRDNYTYGNGEAITTINGGHIHAVYGCSNVKGNIRKEARSVYQRSGTCDMVMDNTYGGSKESDTDGLITVEMDCVENGGTYYGGSYKANIYSDINIHITNGTYDKIFGGNDRAGTINGKITITVEEYGCTPIRINELYAGGNLAPYSVYGYKTETQDALDANGNTYQENGVNVQQRIPYRAGEVGARTTPYWDPRINIISATEIGTIYGGGYGATATVIGNPHVNVNMTEGKIRSTYNDYKPEYATLYPTYDGTGEDKNRVIPIGTIGKIYGGGNLASVEGDTYVEIGTGQWISSWDANGNPVWQSATASGVLYSYKEKTPAVYYTQAECDEYNADPANNVTGYIASGTVLSAEQVTIIKEALGTSYVAGAELTTKDANAYNATLSGARKTTDVKTPAVYYTQEECVEYNATLDGAQDNTDPSTAAAANTYNATLPGARKTTDVKTPAVYYTQAECDEYNKNISGYIAKHTKLSAEQATAVNTALTPNVSAGSPISVEYANAYNATLPNALKTTDVKTEAVWAWYDADNHEMANAPTLAPRNTAKITGDVYGGGKGEAKDSGTGAFQCEKGMIGVDGDGIDYPEGGTSVTIGNGTVTIGGSVYGGGEVGRVEKNTSVTIGLGDGTGTTGYPVVSGDVYGAGKGVPTHGYSALVRGNSTVTIQGDTKVGGNVYGGGEIASIGRYNVVGGRPTSLKNPNSGYCFVTVRGYAEIGPDNMTMTKVGGPDNKGHVFGAGKGAMPYIDKDGNAWAEPWSINKDNGKDIYNAASYTASYSGYDSPAAKAEAEHLKFIETLALATHTDVTIGGHAFVKGDVFGGAEQGFVQHDTHVTIEGDCQIGNGYVQMDAAGSYLAAGDRKSVNRRYTDDEWTEGHLIDNLKDGTTAAATGYTSSLPECASWTYESPYAPHDIYADEGGYDSNGGAVTATNGHTFYGCVFGGGSGYFPYAAGKWHEKAGEVAGNTLVDIKGGHILTNVYGGSEMTNVDGKCTVNMSGGTIGVPRTLGQIVAHPVTCYLFGAGMGDSRKSFCLLTNVQNAEVNVRGGWIYGSVFGGAEDGHVLGNTTVNISDGKIGTYGTSYVDGNVFGGGRGFTGDVQTAGDVGGNVDVFIEGGTMLGSVFGGGRLASVGTWIVEPEDDRYGLFQDDDGSNTYGHVTVNISGGTIGNDLEDKVYDSAIDPTGKTDAELETALAAELTTLKNNDNIPLTEFKYDRENRKFRVSHSKGGNVYGGSMGRLRKLDGIINPIWPELAQVKTTSVNITGGTIKHNVYGGGEFGTVYQDAHVTIGGKWNAATDAVTAEGTGTVYRDVYGGGFGSEDYDPDNSGQYKDATYTFTPMQFAGCVGKTTNVNILGGWVKKNVYGGGEMASVGVVDFSYALGHIHEAKKGSGTEETFTDFGLSWPYELTYQPGFEGTANVTVKGGRIGLTGKDYMGSNTSLTDEQKKALEEDNGDVFGGGRGITGDRYDMAFCANVNNTVVNINYTNSTATPANYKDNEAGVYTNDCVSGSVYGGGENGHVVGNTNVTLANGLIGHAMYGGGKGKDTYRGALKFVVPPSGASSDEYPTDVYGFTSGKVYGNTSITMTGGYVMRNIYGGGNMASIGKGNYAGGDDDYFTLGYGEYVTNLWTPSTGYDPSAPITSSNKPATWTLADHFLTSGKTNVKILGGTVGYIDASNPSNTVKDGLPYGNVFGGARGQAVPNINVLPPYLYTPTSYSGYVNEAKVTIGTAGQSNENAGESGKAPRIYGSVYGGGQDGHVRRDATVTVESGVIGIPFTDAYRTMFGKTGSTTLNEELDNPLWLHRGNVYGSGSGISKYQFDFDNNGDYNGTITYQGKTVKEEDWCSSAGSVTRFTDVYINGGIIHRNVYGGGSRASVGPPPNPMTPGVDPFKKGDTATGHTAGKQSQNTVTVKGTVGSPDNYNEVYGGEVYGASRGDSESGDTYSTSVWTKVHIKNGAVIKGNVFGGGDAGKVKKDTDVIIGD